MHPLIDHFYRSYLKKRILVQNRGGAELYTGGIHQYFEDLRRGANKEFGPKDFFEIASNKLNQSGAGLVPGNCFAHG